jgi:hypothetical protein
VNFVVDATNTTICNEIQPDLVKHCNPQGSFYYVHSASFLDRSLYHKHTNAEGEEIRFRVDFWPNPPVSPCPVDGFIPIFHFVRTATVEPVLSLPSSHAVSQRVVRHAADQ